MKHATILLIGTALLAAPFGASGQSQTIRIVPSQGGGIVVSPSGVPVPATPGAPPQPGSSSNSATKKPEQERLALFLKLTFDRRPSAVLKTWSTPEKTDADWAKEDAEKKKEEEEKRLKAEEAAKKKAEEEAKAAAENPPKEKTPEELEKEAKAKEAAEKAKEAAEKKAEEARKKAEEKKAQTLAIQRELMRFQRRVTLGKWDEVGDFLSKEKQFPKEEDAKKAYTHLLNGLSRTPAKRPTSPSVPGQPVQRVSAAYAEKNVLMPADILGLADAAPVELDKDLIKPLGVLLSRVMSQGSFIEDLVEAMKKGSKRLGGDDPKKKFAAARLLIAANSAADAGAFLPDVDEAAREENVEALNLLALYYLALREKESDKVKENLEKAWTVNQKILAAKELKDEEKTEALTRAVDLAPKVSEELGNQWLVDSYTADPQRGMEVLAAIGSGAARSRSSIDSGSRLQKLQLQSTAVEALLESAAERAGEWDASLNLLAFNWLSEAEYSRKFDTTTTMQPGMQYDRYGNMFWSDNMYQNYNFRGNNQPQPIATGKVLEIKPSDAWLAKIDPSIRPKFSMILAQLYLKVSEEENAFPYIEAIAKTHRDTALDLANEFITVWTSNNDPNKDRRRTSRYMYFWGYSQRADSIPLTRSKQARNLEDLSKWVKRLNELELGDLDEENLAKAFISTHSAAEVYRLEDISKVFGQTDTLKAETLAKLLETMRANLASIWRSPKVQQQQKTKRKDKDIQAEVLRGYEVASAVLAAGLQKYPEAWQLQLVRAAILFDQNNYRQELETSNQFSARRDEAFAEFAKAEQLYVKTLADIDEAKESTSVYETWFYASLGASDIGALKHEHLPDPKQQTAVREALLALPGKAAERHMARFANALSSRVSSVKAELKHRYLKAGLVIAGDRKEAREAKKIFDYYDDLVTEIKLVTTIDGSDVVGHGQPFGMFVDLRHTKQIERESSGFSKYLTNQNSNPYTYNYGRPTENYRDKFEEAAREALKEHFDVMSITFHSEKIKSRGVSEEGWRVTPYAYIMMKASGPEVDEIPSLRIDLDFLDTSGYAVLPIESARVPIDAKPEKPGARPVANLAVVQTLDEREAKEGKLLLEIKVSAHGVVPELDQFLEVKPSDFDVVNIEDKGVSVVQLDAEAKRNSIVSERNWLIELAAKDNLSELPQTFAFATPITDVKEVTYQRYDDADMVMAESSITLAQEYGEVGQPWWLWPSVAAAGVLFLLILFLLLRPRKNDGTTGKGQWQVPEDVTPFTVVTLLHRIRTYADLSDAQRSELEVAINGLEQQFFAVVEDDSQTLSDNGDGNEKAEAEETNLHKIAEMWIRKAA